jgi:hypothetical protein
MSKTWWFVMALAVTLGLVVLLAGCGNKFSQPFKDSPRTSQVNNAPAEIIYMPDGFNNLATKCDHGQRIYVSYHGDGSYGFGFAAPDPACAGK